LSSPKSVYERKPKRLPKSVGFSRYALDFDGVDDYVEVPSDPSLQDPDAVSMCMWVNADTLGTNFRSLINKNGWPTYGRIDNNQDLTWYVQNKAGDVSGLTDVGSVSENVWTHLAFVVSVPDDFQAIYKNGSLVGSQGIAWTGELAWDNSGPVQMGTGPDTLFDGEIVGVLIYNQLLSAEEIRRNMLNYHDPVKDGLVGWWRFEEGTGLTAHDRSGNGNDGTLNPSADPPVWTDVKKWGLRAEAGL